MEKNIDFTEGKIVAPLLKFAGPVLMALFLQAMYGAVDLLVVGKFAGSADVSAVSTGSQIMTTITNLISSLCMGMTILLGQKIGEKKAEENHVDHLPANVETEVCSTPKPKPYFATFQGSIVTSPQRK